MGANGEDNHLITNADIIAAKLGQTLYDTCKTLELDQHEPININSVILGKAIFEARCIYEIHLQSHEDINVIMNNCFLSIRNALQYLINEEEARNRNG